jgi:hypothetical protein
VDPDVSEEYAAFILKVEVEHFPSQHSHYPGLGSIFYPLPWVSAITFLAVCLYNNQFLILYTSIMKMEAVCSSKTSAYKTTHFHSGKGINLK